MKIAILTTKNQWFESYAGALSEKLGNIPIFNNHVDINNIYDIIFILSYHNIIPTKYLKNSKHNLVVHAIALPKGKGWAPLFWQVIEGENKIPFTMIEASSKVDNGDIYMQEVLELTNHELNEELRDKQAEMIIQMCVKFVNNYEKYKIPVKQNDDESFYKKRDKKDSKLNIDKTVRDQFGLLRVVNNSDYPAYFELDGHRYILKIELDNSETVELIDFVDLTQKEVLMILDWRNHENIKKWMYSQDEISVEVHLSFIAELQFSKSRQYMAVKKDNKYVGVVDFTKIDETNKECYFGLYANPFEKIAGIGRILEEVCLKYILDLLSLNKIKLEVFSDNVRALNLYKKYNFKRVGVKNVHDKQVICMELTK